jgi:hypothetical protein
MQGWIKEALLLGRFLSPFFEKIKGFIAAILVYFQFDYY